MKFQPFNRHLWVVPRDQEKENKDPLFIMPDDYKVPQSPYAICDILGMSEDCTISLTTGDTVVVERTTIQEIKADSQTIYVVKENYVYGRIQ